MEPPKALDDISDFHISAPSYFTLSFAGSANGNHRTMQLFTSTLIMLLATTFTVSATEQHASVCHQGRYLIQYEADVFFLDTMEPSCVRRDLFLHYSSEWRHYFMQIQRHCLPLQTQQWRIRLEHCSMHQFSLWYRSGIRPRVEIRYEELQEYARDAQAKQSPFEHFDKTNVRVFYGHHWCHWIRSMWEMCFL